MTVRTALIPLFGRAIRGAGAPAGPAELAPLDGRPLLLRAVDEALEAGAARIVLISVAGREVAAGPVPFAAAHEMRGRDQAIDAVLAAFPGRAISVVRQDQPLGLGHALWCARTLTGGRPCAVLLPTDAILGARGCAAQMAAAHARHGGALIAAGGHAEAGRFDLAPGAWPCPLVRAFAPRARGLDLSGHAPAGRFLLTADVLNALGDARMCEGVGGLTEAIDRAPSLRPLRALIFEGARYDCADMSGYAAATRAFGGAPTDPMPGGADAPVLQAA